MADKINRGALPMVKLTLPIAMEQIFRILVSSVDTMMLSTYNNDAVAAVGLVSQYVFFLTLVFSVIGTGCSIVLAQFLGAKKSDKDLNNIAQASTVMVFVMSLVLTLLVIFGTGALLSCYELEDAVRDYAWQYFVIYGGIFCFFNAFSLLQGAILRSYGYTKEAMIVSIVANLTNVLGNALSLYGWFGLPVLGVAGVAGASGFAMVVSCIMFTVYIRRKKDVAFNLKGITKVPHESFRLVLKVGVPTAGEGLSYNVSQIVIMAMISTLGTNAMSSQVYTMTILRFVFATAMAVGNATQIKAGYYVGAGEKEIAYKKVFIYQLVATGCSMIMIVIVNLIKNPVVSIFTDIPEVHALVCTLLIYSAYMEFGRSLNLVYVGALKGAGDVRFPVLYGIFSNWGIMVLGSYILGIKCGLGLVGFWLGIGTDETTRGIVMLLRWKSRRWQKYALIS
ncbi:MAG: MATE family efflux transporter [Treponemataceae bacterium]|nr:MATE family efflux transporter [Treponemataceae bacterium]